MRRLLIYTLFIFMQLFRLTLLILGYLTFLPSLAAILPANEVFIPHVQSVDAEKIRIKIDIKPNAYLYRERLFSVTVDNSDLIIDDVRLSDGSKKTDDFFGTQSVWYGGKNTASLTLTYQNPQKLDAATIVLKYQGCQDGVICYPPETVRLPIALPQSTFPKSASPQSALPANLPLDSSSSKQSLFKSSALNSGQSMLTTKNLHTNGLLKSVTNNSLLTEDQAFTFVLESQDAATAVLRWNIADGYYLYRNKVKVTSDDDNVAQVQLSEGQAHVDEFFGEQTIYRNNQAIAKVYLKQATTGQILNVSFQGCADKGICYPVVQRVVSLDSGKIDQQSKSAEQSTKINTNSSLIDGLTHTLTHNVWLGMGLLVLAGIALALTPCVLPMLPILLGIITNRRQTSKSRSAVLSSAYVLGMATMLAVFGLVVAKTGINIQIIFQRPLWLVLFAAIFMLMGLAMLGVFSLAMPNGIQNKVTRWQNRFQTNRVQDVFVVGALSSLIVGPCIAPPLIAILAFIATTNNSFLGAVYLFSLGIGMGLPLIIFATVVTQIPKTGELSRLITRILAMLMFAVGLWLLARLLPGYIGLILWGIWLLIVAYYFWRSQFTTAIAKKIMQLIAVVCFALGSVWVVGGIMGNSNPLKPFTTAVHLPFKPVQSLTQLQSELAASNQPVMLDLYADWCVSCQEIEHLTLTDSQVIEALSDWTLLKLDITDTNEEHRAMLTELGLIGPPALLFFRDGVEIKSARNIGTISPESLLDTIKSLR